MRTHSVEGWLYSPEDLVATFGSRLASLQSLAEGFEAQWNKDPKDRSVPGYVFSALASGLVNLREDFGLFEAALDEWLDDPEKLREYAEEAERRRNEAAGAASPPPDR